MPDQYLNMLDLAKKNGAVGPLIEANLERYPEARLFPAEVISGTSFKTLIRTEYADPAFRAVNGISQTVKDSFESKQSECYFLDGHLEVDEATVGADNGDVETLKTTAADGIMKGALRKIGKQIWYGTGNARGDALGFPGALAVTPSSLTIDATGTTESVCSSVYLVCFGEQNARLIFGAGDVFGLKPWMFQRVDRTVNGVSGHLMAHVSNLSGWVGAKWVNPHSIGRIKKLTTDSGKGLTDSLIADLVASFPDDADMSNARLFMTRRSARQLQQSRSTTSVTNSGVKSRGSYDIVAPWPNEAMGIPIEITSSLINTELLAT